MRFIGQRLTPQDFATKQDLPSGGTLNGSPAEFYLERENHAGLIKGSRHVLGNRQNSVTWNFNMGTEGFTVTLTGNATVNEPANAPALDPGQFVEFVMTITQDATGNRVPNSWPVIFKNLPILSTAANAVDVIKGIYDGTNYILFDKISY